MIYKCLDKKKRNLFSCFAVNKGPYQEFTSKDAAHKEAKAKSETHTKSVFCRIA